MRGLRPVSRRKYCDVLMTGMLARLAPCKVDRLHKRLWQITTYTPPSISEVLILNDRRIFVGGETEDCIYGYGPSGSEEDLVRWIGTHQEYDYVWEKARIGMNDGGKLTTEFSASVALHQVNEHQRSATDAKARTQLAELERHVKNEESELAVAEIAAEIDVGWAATLGRVPAYRVFRSWSTLIVLSVYIDNGMK